MEIIIKLISVMIGAIIGAFSSIYLGWYVIEGGEMALLINPLVLGVILCPVGMVVGWHFASWCSRSRVDIMTRFYFTLIGGIASAGFVLFFWLSLYCGADWRYC